jgi:PadR family transcriptional regulator PadR
MPNEIRVTAAVAKVLAAFLEDPAVDRYGLDLMRATNQTSGTLYPILTRLIEAGWAAAQWETDHDPALEGRPARRYYRLTAQGVTGARDAVAALYQQLSRAATSTKASTATTKPRTA